MAQPIENFKSIYRRAKKEGLRLKVHVGEWGSAEDVRRAVEELELHEVQHGISAIHDENGNPILISTFLYELDKAGESCSSKGK